MSTDDGLDAVFRALANATRRAICDELKLRPLTTKQLCAAFSEIDRTTVMLHLRVLERAGRWIGPHAAHAAAGLNRLKRALEAKQIHADA